MIIVQVLPRRLAIEEGGRPKVSGGKIAGELDCSAEVGLEQAIRTTVHWYLDNPGWVASAEKAISWSATSP